MDYMCMRCARILLQKTQRPLRTTTVAQLRSVSSRPLRPAQKPIDLSKPLDGSDSSPTTPSASEPSHKIDQDPPLRIRREVIKSSKPSRHLLPDDSVRRSAAAAASVLPGQLLRRTGPRISKPPTEDNPNSPPQSTLLGRTRAPSVRRRRNEDQEVDTDKKGYSFDRRNRSAPAFRRTAAAQQDDIDEEEEEEEDEEQLKEGEEQLEAEQQATLEEEIAALKDELSQPSTDWSDTQLLAMQSRLRLLTETDDLSAEQRSILEKLSEPESLNNLSDGQVDSMMKRLESLDSEAASGKDDVNASANEDDIAFLEGELSVNNISKWSPAQVLAMQSRLALLVNHDLPPEAQSILRDLSTPQTMNSLTETDIESKIERLKVLVPQDLSKLDAQARASLEAGAIVPPSEPDYAFDLSTSEKRAALEKLSNENIDSLSEEEIYEAGNTLDIIAADGTILSPADARKRFLVKKLLNENVKKLTEAEKISTISELGLIKADGSIIDPEERYGYLLQRFDPDEDDGVLDRNAKYEVEIPDHDRALLRQLSPENISSLSNDEVLNIAGQLNLIGENGELLDPSQYPFSRSDWDDADMQEVDKDEDESEQAVMDNYIETVIDPSPIPTESLPYTPKETTTDELRLDWPNTPLSGEGLTESVLQKVTWLAKRLPHGHWTPSQIAERYADGYLVRFESDEEKETVLKLAADMANSAAQQQSELTGENVEAIDMRYSGISNDEKMKVMDAMARGVYPLPEKQSRAALDDVVRQLGNNESYNMQDSRRFVGRVEKLIGQIGGRAAGQGQGKAKGGEEGVKK